MYLLKSIRILLIRNDPSEGCIWMLTVDCTLALFFFKPLPFHKGYWTKPSFSFFWVVSFFVSLNFIREDSGRFIFQCLSTICAVAEAEREEFSIRHNPKNSNCYLVHKQAKTKSNLYLCSEDSKLSILINFWTNKLMIFVLGASLIKFFCVSSL